MKCIAYCVLRRSPCHREIDRAIRTTHYVPTIPLSSGASIMLYLIAYDITNDSQRNAVYKFLSGWGRRVQKSVFECDLNHAELNQVTSHVSDLIDDATDRCHIYRLCADCISYRTVFGSDLEPLWGETIVI